MLPCLALMKVLRLKLRSNDVLTYMLPAQENASKRWRLVKFSLLGDYFSVSHYYSLSILSQDIFDLLLRIRFD